MLIKHNKFNLTAQIVINTFPHVIHTSVSVGVAVLPQRHLNVLNLLGDSREHSLLQTVELIKASPRSHLAKTHKNTTHGLRGKWVEQEILVREK